MATANHDRTDSFISSEAIELLDCFSNGIDEFILQLAEHVANERTGTARSEITAQDILKAGELLVAMLRHANIPDDVKPAIDSMLQCFTNKVKHRK
jgi:hypothetical protein